MSIQVTRVIVISFNFVEQHAPQGSPFQCARLVQSEINAVSFLQYSQNPFEAIPGWFEVLDFLRFWFLEGDNIGVFADPSELSGDCLRGEHEIDTARSNGAARHAVILCRRSALGEGDPSLGFDRLQTERSVRSRSR